LTVINFIRTEEKVQIRGGPGRNGLARNSNRAAKEKGILVDEHQKEPESIRAKDVHRKIMEGTGKSKGVESKDAENGTQLDYERNTFKVWANEGE